MGMASLLTCSSDNCSSNVHQHRLPVIGKGLGDSHLISYREYIRSTAPAGDQWHPFEPPHKLRRTSHQSISTPRSQPGKMASNEADPDIRSIVDSAAASWYSQRSDPSRSHLASQETPQSNRHATQLLAMSAAGAKIAAPESMDATCWQGALQHLPADFADTSLPIHPLTLALASQPTLRPVEWNQFRQQGGFLPRTPHDYGALMIYLCGQVNPNPCRNCKLHNGPFAQCIVAPTSVLVQSAIRHACANCTYQNQYKKCTNEPLTREESLRSTVYRQLDKNPPTQANDGSTSSPLPPLSKKAKRKYDTLIQDLSSHKDSSHKKEKRARGTGRPPGRPPGSRSGGGGVPADSFDDKLRQARSWSPTSRLRMKAELLQWQAAMATVEADDHARTSPAAEASSGGAVAAAVLTPRKRRVPSVLRVPPRTSEVPAAATTFDIASSMEPSPEAANGLGGGYGDHHEGSGQMMEDDLESEDEDNEAFANGKYEY
ncbi:hypothetical protein GGR56DRAFT_143071 [Xylariaceae sp. FL0804]|nr:hypothetical protein GGR56DRAFT_143071 [Xylariaceae sp. FL0804]